MKTRPTLMADRASFNKSSCICLLILRGRCRNTRPGEAQQLLGCLSLAQQTHGGLHMRVVCGTAPELGGTAEDIPGDLVSQLFVDQSAGSVEDTLTHVDVVLTQAGIHLFAHLWCHLEC